jgi:putative FmdB family regulatory protein
LRDDAAGEVHLPSFEYVCRDCGKEFIVFLTLKEYDAKPKVLCPHCGSDHIERMLSAFTAKTSRKS